MQPLHTARLTLRNFVPADWAALLALVKAHNATEVAQYDHAWPTDEATVRGIAEWFASGDAYLAVCLHDSGALIGYVALPPEQSELGVTYNLGYNLHPDYRGQGYGREAARAMVDYAFGTLGADRLVSGTAIANVASCRLLAWLGFVETGRSTGAFRQDAQGRPVVFEGASFELRREVWAAAQGFS